MHYLAEQAVLFVSGELCGADRDAGLGRMFRQPLPMHVHGLRSAQTAYEHQADESDRAHPLGIRVRSSSALQALAQGALRLARWSID
jgi:hypothetical protein